MGKRKQECCESYKEKGKACKNCPLMKALGKKERRKLLERHARERKK